MIRRIVVSEAAQDEFADVRRVLSKNTVRRAEEFLVEAQAVLRACQEYPFAKTVQASVGTMEIRRAQIRRFPYELFYFVYLSVDFQTGEALDVIYILGCRHEKQAEPKWSTRDPFPL